MHGETVKLALCTFLLYQISPPIWPMNFESMGRNSFVLRKVWHSLHWVVWNSHKFSTRWSANPFLQNFTKIKSWCT